MTKASCKARHLSRHHTSVNIVSSHFLSPFLTLITANFSVTLPDPWIRKQQEKKRQGRSFVSHENTDSFPTVLRRLISHRRIMRNDTQLHLYARNACKYREVVILLTLKGFILIPLLSPKELRKHVPIQPKRINVLTEYVIRVNIIMHRYMQSKVDQT